MRFSVLQPPQATGPVRAGTIPMPPNGAPSPPAPCSFVPTRETRRTLLRERKFAVLRFRQVFALFSVLW
jgi:hypothetical protein